MLPSFLSIRAARVVAFFIIAIAALFWSRSVHGPWVRNNTSNSRRLAAVSPLSTRTQRRRFILIRRIGRVSSEPPTISPMTSRTSPARRPKSSPAPRFTERNVIIIGTIGKSEIIDRLIAERKIDVSAIKGKWESYFTQVVRKPLPGVDSALIICGSDKRGSIYGIYDLSEESGQSPWYYWADVPAKKHAELHVKAGKFSVGEPSVKYRGIFFNDEAPSLSGYIHAKYGDIPPNNDPAKGPLIPAGVANYGHEFYSHVFELLLRCKGNYLWPAMWNNAFNEDDPADAATADMYGIVMGTSHQEPMLRAQKEWDRLPRSVTGGPWNYATHPDVLDQFWRDGLTRNKNYESIITIGLRGENDSAMVQGTDQAIDLLNKIIPAQRKIIGETINPDVTKVPQMWSLYKEVQNYYETGRLHAPDDVTLLWAEDNNGNIRRLPTAEERKRSGGAGIYYHFDYHGGPTDYRWVNTSPISRIWDQMSLAKQYGADRIWIVNVGKFKNIEFATDYWLNLGWNSNRWTNDSMREYTRLWATREFGPEHADEIADIMTLYTKYNGRRKPERLTTSTYSAVNYNEAETVATDYNALASRAEALSKLLPKEEQEAFYELVLFPVTAGANLNEMYVAGARNALYAQQGRVSANDFADMARRDYAKDAELMKYFNTEFAGGKWNHFQDDVHIGYTSWPEPRTPSMAQIHLTCGSRDEPAGPRRRGGEFCGRLAGRRGGSHPAQRSTPSPSNDVSSMCSTGARAQSNIPSRPVIPGSSCLPGKVLSPRVNASGSASIGRRLPRGADFGKCQDRTWRHSRDREGTGCLRSRCHPRHSHRLCRR